MKWSEKSRELMRLGLGDRGHLVHRLLRRRPPLAKRRFIPAHLGVEGFFREFRERNVRYAVLRWFETLPEVAPGEDIDMLIDDADLAAVSDLFHPERGVPCDVYSVTGRPGASHHGVPYLPPPAAIALLDRAVLIGGLYRVPSAEDHFLSLAFHAVYHKGLKSGLCTTDSKLEPSCTPEHDYARELGRLAAELGINVPITLEALQQQLVDCGWRPTDAMLNMLIRRNIWLAARMRKERSPPSVTAEAGIIADRIRPTPGLLR